MAALSPITDAELTELFASLFPHTEINTDPALFEIFACLDENRPSKELLLRHILPEDVRGIISQVDVLFRHPVILLLIYYVMYHDTFLRENWPMSDDLLERVYHSVGYSYRSY